jgi:hypothetical protein
MLPVSKGAPVSSEASSQAQSCLVLLLALKKVPKLHQAGCCAMGEEGWGGAEPSSPAVQGGQNPTRINP